MFFGAQGKIKVSQIDTWKQIIVRVLRVMRLWAVRNPESTGKHVPAVVAKHEILGVQAISAVHNLEILRVLAVHVPRSTYSRLTASALSTRVVPSESNLLQLPLVGPSVSGLCRTMGLRIVDTVPKRSKYTWCSKYTGRIAGISVLEFSQKQYEHYQPTKYC